jgi:hypothetical protein
MEYLTMSISVLYIGESLSAIEVDRKALQARHPKGVHFFAADTFYEACCLLADEGPFDLFIGAPKDSEAAISFYELALANAPDAPVYLSSHSPKEVIQDAIKEAGLSTLEDDQILSKPSSLADIVDAAIKKYNLVVPVGVKISAQGFEHK